MNYPSSVQMWVSNDIASKVCDLLIAETKGLYTLARKTSGSGHQTPNIPDSMVREWAGTSAENLRKMMLQYWREMGLFPE
jgi:hypothetical protein